MEISLVIRRRLKEMGLEQRDLARAAQVTESYISQLLTRKKAPPAPDRTDLYDKMEKVLKFPHGELARLAGDPACWVACPAGWPGWATGLPGRQHAPVNGDERGLLVLGKPLVAADRVFGQRAR